MTIRRTRPPSGKRKDCPQSEQNVITLVEPVISHSTLQVVEALRNYILAGECIGIAYVAILRGGRYSRGYTGMVNYQPEIAIGILHRIIHDLEKQADKDSGRPPEKR